MSKLIYVRMGNNIILYKYYNNIIKSYYFGPTEWDIKLLKIAWVEDLDHIER